MKKKQLIALGVTLFVLAACNNPFFPEKRDIGGNIAQTPVVTIDVTPENPYIQGDEVTITASAAVSDGGTLSYQWYGNDKESNEGGKLIPDETGTSYAPSTSGAGTVYYYVKVTNTLGEETASAVSDTVEVTVYDVGTAAAIRSVSVNVIAPVKNGTPATTAVTDDSGYTCTAVSWNPAHNLFQIDVAYTVTITLTAESNHTFIALRTALINGQAATVTENNDSTVTLTYAFAEIIDPNIGMDGTTEATAFKVYDVETLNLVGKGTGGWEGDWSLSAHYVQIADIVLPPVGTGESNWTPIGNDTNQFTGTYDGGEYTISNLTITITSAGYYGMFGYIGNGSIVKNIGLVIDINVGDGSSLRVGGVVGTNSGTVQNCYSTGDVKGTNNSEDIRPYIGGVVGENSSSGTVQNCYSTGNFNILFFGNNGIIYHYVGGVVGTNSGTVKNCYSTGNVSVQTTGLFYVGGVVGSNNGILQNCYSTGSVGGSSNRRGYSGGVVGENSSSGTVQNCYSTGNFIYGISNSSSCVVKINSGTVQNCVALNPRVTSSFTTATAVSRVVEVTDILVNNNYARSDMVLKYNWNGSTGTDRIAVSNLNGVDGQDITPAQYHSESWWSNAGNWKTDGGASAWDFVNVWEWNSATGLPILRNMPAGPQNHTVPPIP